VVELIIAISLLALVMVSLGPAFWGSLQATTTSNNRTTADGIAVQALEELRGDQYYQVGFTGAAGNNPAPSNTQCPGSNLVNNVTTSALAPGGASTVGPIRGITFSVQVCVYWTSAYVKGTLKPGAYKETVGTVTWADADGPHTVTETSALYPGGEGAYSGTGQNNYDPRNIDLGSGGGGSPAIPNPPQSASIADDSVNPTTAVDVSWTPPVTTPVLVTGWTIQFTDDTNANGSGSMFVSNYPTASTSATVINLTPGHTYSFQVSAQSASVSSTPTATTPTSITLPTTPPCTVSSVTVTPSTGTVDFSGNLTSPSGGFSITAQANGTCQAGAVQVQYSTQPPGKNTTFYLANMSGSGTLTGSAYQSGSVWQGGTIPFTVVVNGTVTSVSQPVTLCQLKRNGTGCP